MVNVNKQNDNTAYLLHAVDLCRTVYIDQLSISLIVHRRFRGENRSSPPTDGVPISRLDQSMWVLWWTKSIWVGCSRYFPRISLLKISFHHLSTLILFTHFVSFHYIRLCDGASGVIWRHPCYSQTFNKSTPSHLIPRLGSMSDISWGHFFLLLDKVINFT